MLPVIIFPGGMAPMMSVIPKKLYRFICVLFALSISSPAAVQCDIYKYVDKNGVMHFTNVPTASSAKFRVFLRESPVPTASSAKFRIYLRESSPYLRKPETHDFFQTLIHTAAQEIGIAAPLIKAIIKAESNFNPQAVSKKGALGLMQIMPSNFKSLNIRDPFDPKQNIMGGAQYFKQMMNRFDGKLHLALAAYNAGPETVERYQRIPPIRETENYVRRVLKYYNQYKKS
jgi:soluble lytic murein transglycosylase